MMLFNLKSIISILLGIPARLKPHRNKEALLVDCYSSQPMTLFVYLYAIVHKEARLVDSHFYFMLQCSTNDALCLHTFAILFSVVCRIYATKKTLI